MFPHERSLVEKLKDKPFALLGVNSDDDKAEYAKRLVSDKITWRSWYDESTSGPIATRFNVHGWPTIYVLDKDHKIRFKNLRGDALEKAIDELVAEAERPAAKPPGAGG